MASASANQSEASGNARLQGLLDGFRPDSASGVPEPLEKAIYLARILQQRASELQTAQERRQQDELERIMRSPHDKATLVQITDQALRSRSAPRAAEQLIHILDVQGIPRFFSALDKALLQGFRSFGGYLPEVTVPMVQEKLREETANVILPAEEEHLLAHLRARHQAGLRMNLNLLGEALLGEKAVAERLATYLEVLRASGGRVPLGQDLHHRLPDLGAGLGGHGRAPVRPPGAPVSGGGAGAVSAPGRGRDAEVRLPGHGGVPGHADHRRGLHAHPRAARAGGRRSRDRPAGLSPGRLRGPAADQRMGPNAGASGRRPRHHPARQGRQHGDGAGGRGPSRLAPGPVPDQARDRCQFQAHAPRGPARGEHRRRASGDRLSQPVRRDLRPGPGTGAGCAGPGPVRDARGHGQPPAPGAGRGGGQPAALCPGHPPRAVRPCRWLPGPASGREYGTGQLPRPRLQAAGGQRRLGAADRAVPRLVRADRLAPRRAAPHPGPASASGATAGDGRSDPGPSRQRARYRLRPPRQRRMGSKDRCGLGSTL